MSNQFGKSYKLCSKTIINYVFNEGCVIKRKDVFVRFVILNEKKNNNLQFLISAPKRKFRKAVQRNYIKRVLREIVRTKKQILDFKFRNENKSLFIVVNYHGALPIEYKNLENQISEVFSDIINETHKE